MKLSSYYHNCVYLLDGCDAYPFENLRGVLDQALVLANEIVINYARLAEIVYRSPMFILSTVLGIVGDEIGKLAKRNVVAVP